MAEWLKEDAWKACLGETLTWVRIPLSPPEIRPARLPVSRAAHRDRPLLRPPLPWAIAEPLSVPGGLQRVSRSESRRRHRPWRMPQNRLDRDRNRRVGCPIPVVRNALPTDCYFSRPRF